jgi:hypothetical protein
MTAEMTAEAVYSGTRGDIMAFVEWLSDRNGRYFLRRVLLNAEPGRAELSSVRITFSIFGLEDGNEKP